MADIPVPSTKNTAVALPKADAVATPAAAVQRTDNPIAAATPAVTAAEDTSASASASASSTAPQSSSKTPDEEKKDKTTTKKGTCILVIGMAGSGKTTLMQRLNAHLHSEGRAPYVVNLDPAVHTLPFDANIDVRDTVKYKEVMSQYGLGPNGAIVTSLNLFATRFDQALKLIEKRAQEHEYVLFDTPGQIEVFTWSASGTIITETLANAVPTCVVYVADTPRCANPVTFMSNMMYACSILYKTKLPFFVAFNKVDIVSHDFAMDWMQDFECFQQAVEEEGSYAGTLARSMSLVLEEFYASFRAVGVSAYTGEGMDDFFGAVDACTQEYHDEYAPLLEKLRQDKAKRETERQRAALDKLKKDMQAGGRVVLDAGAPGLRMDPEEEERLAAAAEAAETEDQREARLARQENHAFEAYQKAVGNIVPKARPPKY